MSVELDSDTKTRVRIYVRLLGEGTDVSRPTQAVDLGNGRFRLEAIPEYDPESETWEFVPGSEVRGEVRSSASGNYLLATAP
jgi:hypothetical protein